MAETVARAFISRWISRFSIPSTVTTNHGSQFESALWTQLMHLLGSKRIRTTAYHLNANGFIKHLHRQLKIVLKCQPNPNHWADSLPLVLLDIRTALKEDIRCISAEQVYDTSLHLPGEFFDHTKDNATADPAAYVVHPKSTMQNLKATPVRSHPQRKVHVSDSLATCTRFCMLRCDS